MYNTYVVKCKKCNTFAELNSTCRCGNVAIIYRKVNDNYVHWKKDKKKVNQNKNRLLIAIYVDDINTVTWYYAVIDEALSNVISISPVETTYKITDKLLKEYPKWAKNINNEIKRVDKLYKDLVFGAFLIDKKGEKQIETEFDKLYRLLESRL